MQSRKTCKKIKHFFVSIILSGGVTELSDLFFWMAELPLYLPSGEESHHLHNDPRAGKQNQVYVVESFFIHIPLTRSMRSWIATVSVLQRAIAEVKQRWPVIGWVTKNLLSRATPCFGRHVKPLVPVHL
jgi:hypothetical protein